jgi:tetratricopeptide (TPR) repeat protein
VLLDAEPAAAIRALVQSNLLNELPENRYTLHDLVRLAAHAAATDNDDPADRAATLHRVASASIQAVNRAGELLRLGPPQPYLVGGFTSSHPVSLADRNDARAWLAAECDNLLALIRDLANEHADAYMWPLACELQLFLFTTYRLDEWYAIEPLVEDAAHRVGDLRAQTAVAHARGLARQYQARWPEALSCYENALALAERAGDELLLAHMETYVARILRVLDRPGDLERAADLLDHALTVAVNTANEINLGYIRLELGSLAFQSDRFTDATRETSVAIEIAERLDEAPLRRLGNHNMACVCLTDANARLDPLSVESQELRRLGERHARVAIAVAREIGVPVNEARSWEQLGYILMYENRRREGQEAFDRALAILDALHDVRADTLRGLIDADDWDLTALKD